MSVPLRVGLVGYGMAARIFHAPFLRVNPRLRVTHVVERHRQDSLAAFPQATIVRSIEELLSQPVELVVVLTPNASHYEIAAAALRAGKHVVVDKPFTVSSREAGVLIALAKQTGRVLSVFHNRRWDGDFLTVRELVEQESLGRLVELESAFYRYRPVSEQGAWREHPGPGAGLLYDLGPHLIDQALVLFGRPDAVTADLRRLRDPQLVDDCFDIRLHYSGLRVRLKATLLARAPGPRFILHGTHGSYVKFCPDPQEEALKQGQPPDSPGWGTEPESRWGVLYTGEGEAAEERTIATRPGRYHAYYENICDAVEGRTPPAVTAEQARATVRLIEAACESDRQQRTREFE